MKMVYKRDPNKESTAELEPKDPHREWTIENWVKLIWNDEVKINITTDGVELVRHPPREDAVKRPISAMVS